MKLPIVMGWRGYNNLTGDVGGLDIFLRAVPGSTLLFLRPSKFSLWLANWFMPRFPL